VVIAATRRPLDYKRWRCCVYTTLSNRLVSGQPAGHLNSIKLFYTLRLTEFRRRQKSGEWSSKARICSQTGDVLHRAKIISYKYSFINLLKNISLVFSMYFWQHQRIFTFIISVWCDVMYLISVVTSYNHLEKNGDEHLTIDSNWLYCQDVWDHVQMSWTLPCYSITCFNLTSPFTAKYIYKCLLITW
jgi:hypothetical protein